MTSRVNFDQEIIDAGPLPPPFEVQTHLPLSVIMRNILVLDVNDVFFENRRRALIGRAHAHIGLTAPENDVENEQFLEHVIAVIPGSDEAKNLLNIVENFLRTIHLFLPEPFHNEDQALAARVLIQPF